MSASIHRTAFSPLSFFALITAGVTVLPLLYVTSSALFADLSVWHRLWTTRIPELLFNTVSLAAGVALGTLVLGVSLAWMTTRYRFAGSRFWEWALILPLTIPSYVLAYVYTFLLGTQGPLEQLWQIVAGSDARIISPYSYTGAAVVLTLNTFPFVYLLARSALLNLNVSFEETAAAMGLSRINAFFQVSLPMLRPSLAAGLFLALFYVVSDFGAVSLLRYQTFTYAIYQQMTSRYDHQAAAALSLILILLALGFLIAERRFRRRSRFYQTTGTFRRIPQRSLGLTQTFLISVYLLLVFSAAFGIPLVLLIQWTISAISDATLTTKFFEFTTNSFLLSAAAATVALVMGTPLAYLACRRPTRLNLSCMQAAYASYVLPGPVGALALLIIFTQGLPFLYGTVIILLFAYLIHFLPVGLQGMESAIQQVNPNMEEAARTLGAGGVRTFRQVTLPLVQGGFLAAWIMMFIQCMKELPATLLLRPVGFDTLAVRIWLEASEELYQLAAPPALLLVIMTLPVITVLAGRTWRLA